MPCPRCGCVTRKDAVFCGECGAHLIESTIPQDAFIGRRTELAALDAALERVLAGQGRILLLSGDPGIGKTRTAQELAARAESQGMRVLWGRCYEEPGAPLYWPWLQLLRGLLDDADETRLTEALGDDAGVIAELLPELRQRLPDLRPPPPLADPGQARFRVFDAVTRFWQQAVRQQPLALILDDLHCADTASLKLLEFLARELTASPLLLLGAYRDVELSRHDPLSDTLATLSRLSHCQRLPLGGMSPEETEQFLATFGGASPLTAVAAAVYQHSEGNPLFLRELTRHLLREGLPADGRLPSIPAGIREVIGQRLNHLSENCNRVLDKAAVIGRRFELELLTGLDETLAEAELLDALEESLDLHILEELPQPGRYQFSHALIRETLYEELSATRRLRLHRRVGERLEVLHRQDLQPHLPQLAYHFAQAAPAGTAEQAIDYTERAGERADVLLAYEEAVHFYRLALDLQEHHFPQNAERRCRLLLALADARNRAGASVDAQDIYLQAADLARSLGLTETLARIALGFENAGWRVGHSGTQAIALLEESLALLQPEDERLRADLLAALCRANIYCDRPQQANAALRQAVRLARRLNEPRTLFNALSAIVPARYWPEQLEERLAAAREAHDLVQQAGHPEWAVGQLTGWYFGDLMEYGDVETACRVLDIHLRVVETFREPFLRTVALSARTLLAIHQGRFTEAERLAQETGSVARPFFPAHAEGVYGVHMFTLRREQGKLGELLPVLKHFVHNTPETATWRPGLALVYAELDLTEEAHAKFETLAANDFAAIPHDGVWSTSITYLAEVCAHLNDSERAATLYQRLLPYAGRNIVTGAHTVCYGSADRFLGLLAMTQQQWEQAEGHFQAALTMDERTGGRPWLAHSRYQYARLLVRRRQPERASALLEAALETARELGMAALERRCEALQEKPGHRPVYPDGLSAREVQVLHLLAAGKSNRQIAETLFISPNTVANHVRGILTKTNTDNRTEAAAYAIRHGLAGK